MLRGYRLLDYLTQLYIAVVGILILLFHGDYVRGWPYLVAAHAGCIVAVHVLIRFSEGRKSSALVFLRHFYPMVLFTVFYRETGLLQFTFCHQPLDPFFQHLEEVLFGSQPSFVLMASMPAVVVSEWFYLSYFSYYVMIFGVGLALYLRDRRQFLHYLTIVGFIFYVCYLTYIFLPVLGPRSEYIDFAGYPEAVQRGPFFKVMALIYRYCEPEGGAAFPSSHIAVALATVYFSWRYLRRIRWPHLVMVVSLIISTVYCRYHYAVDSIAGVLTAALLIPAGELLYKRCAGEVGGRPPSGEAQCLKE